MGLSGVGCSPVGKSVASQQAPADLPPLKRPASSGSCVRCPRRLKGQPARAGCVACKAGSAIMAQREAELDKRILNRAKSAKLKTRAVRGRAP